MITQWLWQQVQPFLQRRGLAAAVRDLRVLAAQGRRGAGAVPPALLPGLARQATQGLLNGAVLPRLDGWSLPYSLRRQLDPADPGYHTPGHSLLLLNRTYRNWTAVGVPGLPDEATVDPCGLVTPRRGGPSLDAWVQPYGRPLLVAAAQPATSRRQRMQGRLPVVASAFEAEALRLSTEVWAFTWDDLGAAAGPAPPSGAAWLAVQAVVFNSSDDPLRGRFTWALRPFNPEGVAPITRLAYHARAGAFVQDGTLAALFQPTPNAWDIATGQEGDLAGRLPVLTGRTEATHPAGLVHGVVAHDFLIEPWEEAEFLALCPLSILDFGFWIAEGYGAMVAPLPPVAPLSPTPNAQPLTPISYSTLKGRVTRQWQARLGAGMTLRLPDSRLEESWEASKGHLLTLWDGDTITPGPATYHDFWLRDAAYMLAALAATGYGAEAWQVLETYPKRQGRDGAFEGPRGEWDGTGQALWTVAAVDGWAPDMGRLRALYPALARGGHWLRRATRVTRTGLLPPSLSAQHLGPPDCYYWDNFWGLAGLEALARIAARLGQARAAAQWTRAAYAYREALLRHLAADVARLGTTAIPAAPGRQPDAGMIGGLAAWWPLRLFPADDPRLAATLSALERAHFHEGAYFHPIQFGGWGSYLNMHIAQCRLQQRDPAAWDMIVWLFRHATPTYTWPEAISPRTGGGAYGDGAHGWASADWLLLLRNMCLFEEGDRLVLGAGWPQAWFDTPGEIAVAHAPTQFGPLSSTLTWNEARSLHLTLDAATPPPGGYELWLPFAVEGSQVVGSRSVVRIAMGAREVELRREDRS